MSKTSRSMLIWISLATFPCLIVVGKLIYSGIRQYNELHP